VGGKVQPVRKTDNLIAIYEPIVKKMWDPRRLKTLWVYIVGYKDNFTFLIIIGYDH
jgi:hypothetical protein